MPLLDMPLEQLHQYQGRNPKPDDFDQYWQRALDELSHTDFQVELRPSEFQVPFATCYDLFFTGVGKARIHAHYLRPTFVEGKHPAILQFHGYSGNAGDFSAKLAYVSLGYSVFAMDVRGQGGLSEDSTSVKGTTLHGHIIRGIDDVPDRLLFRQIFLDTVALFRIAAEFEEVDPARIGVTGWSQGGGLTLACAALEPRVARIAPVYPFLSDYLRVWEMDMAKNAYEELRTYFRHHDPQHKREHEIFQKLGYIDIQHLASRIQSEVLMGVGLMDDVCPPSTQFATYNKIKANKSLVIYPDFGHEGLPAMQDHIMQFMLKL